MEEVEEYQIRVMVSTSKLKSNLGDDFTTIEDAIEREMGWVVESGIGVLEVTKVDE